MLVTLMPIMAMLDDVGNINANNGDVCVDSDSEGNAADDDESDAGDDDDDDNYGDDDDADDDDGDAESSSGNCPVYIPCVAQTNNFSKLPLCAPAIKPPSQTKSRKENFEKDKDSFQNCQLNTKLLQRKFY